MSLGIITPAGQAAFHETVTTSRIRLAECYLRSRALRIVTDGPDMIPSALDEGWTPPETEGGAPMVLQ